MGTNSNMNEREKYKVKQAIAMAFIAILNEKKMDDISIREITERAGVSRMAYYRNFDNKIEILEYYFECNFNELIEMLDKPVELWSYEFGQAFFSLMKRHKNEVLLLDELGFSGLILHIFNEYNELLAGDMVYDSIERYRLYYAAGASYNAALQWLREDCKESIDSISRNCADFIGVK